VKPPNLAKGVHLEGFRKVGVPANFAFNYFQQDLDEINNQDIVASLYELFEYRSKAGFKSSRSV
jgi:cyclase